jgi:Transposase DDE domain
MTVFDTLLAPVMPILQQIEAGRKKHHNEQFLWIDFVRILVFYFTKRCGSLNALIVALENADPALGLPTVPKMTLSDAFRRFPSTLLRQALTSLVTTLNIPENPELALIGPVHAGDGSEFPVVGGMMLPRSTERVPSMKLHLIFNLNQMITADFLVDSANSSERSAIRTMLQAGVTYVLDRGYMAFDLLRDIIGAQAFVVMRAYNTIVTETVKELPVTLPDSVVGHWIQVRDRIVQSSHPDAAGIFFRLVECTVGTTTYRLITNRADITTFQVIVLYAYRWQIELIFRFFKHTLNGIEVITQSKKGIDTFFAAMFLTAILQLYLKIDCLEQGGYLPPTQQDVPKEQHDNRAQISSDSTRSTAHLAIAVLMARMNDKLALFWKIPKHWLSTVSDYLDRSFTPFVRDIFNKRALSCCRVQ